MEGLSSVGKSKSMDDNLRVGIINLIIAEGEGGDPGSGFFGGQF